MAVSASEELKLYGNLLYNALFSPKFDMYKIPGPPGYWLWGASSRIGCCAASANEGGDGGCCRGVGGLVAWRLLCA